MKAFIILCFIFISFNALSADTKKVLVVLGDSLTEGYGVAKEEAFPAILEKKIHSLGKKEWKVINAGVSGSTTASGQSRLKWFLKSKPRIILLALGANDGLRGLKLGQTKKNLEKIIQKAQEMKIKVVLGGMQIPTNYGKEYRKKFHQMYKDLAKKYKLTLIPFLLEGVGGRAELNISDGIHPNQKGHEVVAKNVLSHIQSLL